MCLIFVVDNVLQLNAKLLRHGVEKVLPIDVSNAANLRYGRFLLCVVVDKIRRDGQSESSTELFCSKTGKTVLFAIGCKDDVIVVGRRGTGGRICGD